MYRIEHFEFHDARAQALRVRAGSLLRLGAGRLWITLEGGSEDIWLQPGEQWCAPRAARLWLSAEPLAQFEVLHAVARTAAPEHGIRSVQTQPPRRVPSLPLGAAVPQ